MLVWVELCTGLGCAYATMAFETEPRYRAHRGCVLHLFILRAQSMFIAQWILNKYLLNE